MSADEERYSCGYLRAPKTPPVRERFAGLPSDPLAASMLAPQRRARNEWVRSHLEPSRRYWVAMVAGADFDKLRDLGFFTLYPAVDDYVFLQAIDANTPLTSEARAASLGLEFLRDSRERLQVVCAEEIRAMAVATVGQIEAGSRVEVVRGTGAGLEGEVLEIDEDRLRCRLEGRNQTFELEVSLQDVLPAPEPPEAAPVS